MFFQNILYNVNIKYFFGGFIMKNVYTFNGYIFRKDKDASDGGAYFTIIHPDGRYLDCNHYFSSPQEMKQWIQNRII